MMIARHAQTEETSNIGNKLGAAHSGENRPWETTINLASAASCKMAITADSKTSGTTAESIHVGAVRWKCPKISGANSRANISAKSRIEPQAARQDGA